MCLELNTLFARLLRQLKDDLDVLSGGTYLPGDTFAPDPEHMLMLVRIDGEEWLADVGHAGLLLHQLLRLVEDEPQWQYGCAFRLVAPGRVPRAAGQDAGTRLAHHPTVSPLRPGPAPTPGRASAAATGSAILAAMRRRWCFTERGQVFLTSNMFTTVEDGHEKVCPRRPRPACAR
ncbi:Acetyltransferase OS=Streptomyces fumanus OX=67302 GN=GCM10018772_36620 PE=3 SV=1 [Streptomyces fumanus]